MMMFLLVVPRYAGGSDIASDAMHRCFECYNAAWQMELLLLVWAALLTSSADTRLQCHG